MKKTLFLTLLAASVFGAVGLKAQSNEAGADLWTTNAPAALEQAKSEGKLVLMNFTGSDWCIWCKRLDGEVFSTKQFQSYAKENLVLLKLDFPNRSQQPDWEVKQNQALAEKYGIEGFPTILVLNSEGEEVARLGYQRGGPEAWLKQLEGI